MDLVHGFLLLEKRTIDELKLEARLYQHARTGAQLLSLVCSDENKAFGVTLRTPPKDSTGVAHILEHSVLCGSRKYPVKEPFVELLKGSLKTFLNAFTYPDKTCYPVASQNLRDFYNLVDVYLDAVFYPRLTPEVLMQEGWHHELSPEQQALTFQGVVYGEMKGVFSSPDSRLGHEIQHSLFPDNTYGLVSGGDPKNIPDLTFEQFEGFHKKYYHPSNARFFFYGDDEPDERLRLVDDFIKEFDRKEVDSQIAPQPSFKEPRRIEEPYAVSEDPSQAKSMISLNWLLPEPWHRDLALGMRILDYILIGMPASPLRKALIDSGLGEDLVGGGLENELRQMFYSVGLKGVDPDKVDKVESLIVSVLTDLSQKGIDKELIEAALNSVEFRLRETHAGSFPRGLVFMLVALTTWLYDADPLSALAFEGPLAKVKSEALSGNRYFESMLQTYFLDNPHRTTVVLRPDPELARKTDEEENGRLQKALEAMTPPERQAVIEQAEILRNKQQTPDSPQDLATIPHLAVADLPRENKKIPCETFKEPTAQTPIYYHDIDSYGIVYLDLGFGLAPIAQEDLALTGLWGRMLLETGTATLDFVGLSRRISAQTGGIWASSFVSAVNGAPRTAAYLMVRGKAMVPKGKELMSILQDVLQSARMDDRERFRQIVLEEKAGVERALVPNGHGVVDSRLRAQFAEPNWIDEQMGGLSYLFYLRKLVDEIDSNWSAINEKLERIRTLLVNRQNMVVNVTMNQASYKEFEPHLSGLMQALPSTTVVPSRWQPKWAPGGEGWLMPAQVNYVGKGVNLFDQGYKYHGSCLVISRFLRTGYLWNRVRVQGGAYGAFCRLDRLTGVFTMVSYRDPNLSKTLRCFDETGAYLRDLKLDQEEIDKNIIGAIGDLDAYLSPDGKGHVSFARKLTEQTEEQIQKLRNEVFETRLEHFQQFGNVLESLRTQGRIAVLGGKEMVEKSATEWGLSLNTVL